MSAPGFRKATSLNGLVFARAPAGGGVVAIHLINFVVLFLGRVQIRIRCFIKAWVSFVKVFELFYCMCR